MSKLQLHKQGWSLQRILSSGSQTQKSPYSINILFVYSPTQYKYGSGVRTPESGYLEEVVGCDWKEPKVLAVFFC